MKYNNIMYVLQLSDFAYFAASNLMCWINSRLYFVAFTISIYSTFIVVIMILCKNISTDSSFYKSSVQSSNVAIAFLCTIEMISHENEIGISFYYISSKIMFRMFLCQYNETHIFHRVVHSCTRFRDKGNGLCTLTQFNSSVIEL